MKISSLPIHLYILFSLIICTIILTGCTLARVLVTEELMFMRVAGIRTTAARIAIVEEATAMRSITNNIARLRIKPGTLGRPVLYLPEAGVNKPLFEMVSQTTMRRMATGELFELPFRVFRTNGLATAELRSGPGMTYKLYKTIPKDRFVLIRDQQPGWYLVQYETLLAWVAVAALSPAVADDSHFTVTYTDIECYNCDGVGTKDCEDCNNSGAEDCPSCSGKGNHQCTHCNSKGQNTCLLCKGKNSNGCPSCKGVGVMACQSCKAKGSFDCRLCRATGKISCAVCDDTLHTKCYYCFGTKKITKRDTTK